MTNGARENYKTMTWAISGGNLDIIKELIKRYANTTDEDVGDTFEDNLLWNKGQYMEFFLDGCESGHINVVKFIISSNNNLSLDEGIFCAAHNGHIELTRYLLQLGADPKKALQGALHSANYEISTLLLSHTDITKATIHDFYHSVPGGVWVQYTGSKEFYQLLIECNVKIPISEILERAIGRDDIELFSFAMANIASSKYGVEKHFCSLFSAACGIDSLWAIAILRRYLAGKKCHKCKKLVEEHV
jgi:hypothetical protein